MIDDVTQRGAEFATDVRNLRTRDVHLLVFVTGILPFLVDEDRALRRQESLNLADVVLLLAIIIYSEREVVIIDQNLC